MQDLSNPTWIKVKGILFLFLGLVSALWLLSDHPTPKIAILLVLSVWSLCRFYYFAFYVVERYVDPNYRYSGLLSLARYLLGKKREQSRQRVAPNPPSSQESR
jgi:hypothetical protein